ncbi:MAG: YraN family protein [Gammaproteobacteria bacterium]|nr:MAG: YraN family protein [Gammaproteobacteria bacterium]
MGSASPTALCRGNQAEELACVYLQNNGLKLVERNYRSPFGEIDLVMQQQETLVFVEVRFRRNEKFGTPGETVDARKQAKLRACAEHYLQRAKNSSKKPCRFDIVAVTGGHDGDSLKWLKNAF